MTTIYITKYAVTTGPFEVDAEVKNDGTLAVYRAGGYPTTVHTKEFWLTKFEALVDCERRRKAKLASIDKRRAKIEKMEFKL